jgi:signal transduction histidine kinase
MNLRPSPSRLDALAAVVAAAAAVAVQHKADVVAVDARLHQPDLVATVVTVAAALTLFWWRSRPVRACVALIVATTAVSALSHYVGLLPWLLTCALWALAVHGPRLHSLAALAAAWLSYSGLTLMGVPDNTGDAYLSTTALLVAAWALGDGVRSRRSRVDADLRAARRDAAAAREEADRARMQERLRIARELHDVVAHSMSLIAVQAGVGAHLIHTRPDQAESTLNVIAETSREALAQTRSLLGLLRSGDVVRSGDTDSPVAPVPRLAELHALIASVRGSGVAVDYRADGEPVNAAPAVQLAAYRIVQESLTNVVKHAHASTASVQVTYRPGAIDIEVIDDGIGPPDAPVDGHGLRGLRERAAMLGGSLSAGPAGPAGSAGPAGPAGGGFRIWATLPAAGPPIALAPSSVDPA